MSKAVDQWLNKYAIPEPNSGCWLWLMATNSHGYGHLSVRGRMIRSHRISYELANGSIPSGLHVCHKCDVRLCVNPAHLFLGTRRDNMADMVSKGRQWHGPAMSLRMRGEGHGAAKLREVDALAILASREPQRLLAERYGITQSAVSHIKRGRMWSHLRAGGAQ